MIELCRARLQRCLQLNVSVVLACLACLASAQSGRAHVPDAAPLDRSLLCHVERAYIERRRAGLEGIPDGLFFGPAGALRLDVEERRTPVLARHRLSPARYAAVIGRIATLGSSTPTAAQIAAADDDTAFLLRHHTELVDVFGGGGDIPGVRLSRAQDHRAAAAIARHCR